MSDNDFKRSPYLELHKNDAIKWNIWDNEIIKRAKQEDKPLFISIGYYSCHWCHIEQELAFNDKEIARIINEKFVPIIVDREERPDIDDFYMRASQIINGSGGWPLNVIAMPDGRPFFVSTFLYPRESGDQPGLLEILSSIYKIWNEERGRVLETSDEILSLIARKSKSVKGKISFQEINEMIGSIYDRKFGGFGSSPKFPNFNYLQFLMIYDHYSKKNSNRSKVEKTIRAIINGGIYDQIGSGIHRYSTDEKWEIPHFEKMLYDQGMLLETLVLFTDTYGDPLFMNIAKDIVDFLIRDMNIKGLFLSAIDSDFNGEEGLYYLWDMREISEILNENEITFLRDFFDFSVKYNGKIIIRRKDLNHSKEDEAKIRDIIMKLRNTREKRGEIRKDDKIILSWNCLTLKAIIHYSYHDPSYISFLENAVKIMEEKFVNGGDVLRTIRKDEKGVKGQLEDYAYLSDLFLEMYILTIDESYLNKAIKIVNSIKEKFYDPLKGCFYNTQKEWDIAVIRTEIEYDTIFPSGKSLLYYVLTKLYILTGIEEMMALSLSIRNDIGDSINRNPIAFISLITFMMSSERTYKVEIGVRDVVPFKENRKGIAQRNYFLPKIGEGLNLCDRNSCLANFRNIEELVEYIKKLSI
ncbi:MAG: thioredoxin domain-containing protein [Thermoplasmata archaeon]